MLEKLFKILKQKPGKAPKSANKDSHDSSENTKPVEKLLPYVEMQSDILVTVVGMNHYFGTQPFDKGNKVYLVKEPGNTYDSNAIMVICDGYGKCGYVANSEYTVKSGTVPASILNVVFNDVWTAKVLFVEENFSICSVDDLSIFDFLMSHCKQFMFEENYESALILLEQMQKRWNTDDILVYMSECSYQLGYLEKAQIYANTAQKFNSSTKKAQYILSKIDQKNKQKS